MSPGLFKLSKAQAAKNYREKKRKWQRINRNVMGVEASTPLPDHTGPLSLASRTSFEDSDETLLLHEAECFVYKIGARVVAEGHAAASWGLDSPVATCALRVTAWGDHVAIALWRRVAESGGGGGGGARNGSSYAATHPLTLQPATSGGCALVALSTFAVRGRGVHPLSHWLEPTLDSSRYFVMRCVRPGTTPNVQGALLLGIGFRHRESAFSLRACLSDHWKRCERLAKAAEGDEGAVGVAATAATPAPVPVPPPAPAASGASAASGVSGDDDFSAFESAPPLRAPVPLLAPPRGVARAPPPAGNAN